jgi:iron complex transport system ATP-binding protein
MILTVDGIEFAYRSARVLDEVNFAVAPGEFLAVLGNNGAGKSTLLKCLNRILSPQSGTVVIDGADVRHLDRLGVARKMGYVPQRPDASQMTVFDAVLLGRKPHITWDATSNDLDIAHRMIARLGLEHLALRPLHELSGGELQKTVIARALAQEPRVILLDEPTSSLDLRNQLDVLDTVRRVTADEGVSVISVMHDLNLALRFASSFLFLSKGAVFAAGGPEVITAENVEHVYDVRVRVPVFNGMPVVVPV